MTATIVLYVPGATETELDHGIEVAKAILERDGIAPEVAQRCQEERARRNATDTPPALDVDMVRAWFSYDAARWAAIATCLERTGGAEVDCLFDIVVDPRTH